MTDKVPDTGVWKWWSDCPIDNSRWHFKPVNRTERKEAGSWQPTELKRGRPWPKLGWARANFGPNLCRTRASWLQLAAWAPVKAKKTLKVMVKAQVFSASHWLRKLARVGPSLGPDGLNLGPNRMDPKLKPCDGWPFHLFAASSKGILYSPRFAWGGRPHRRFISVRERG